MKTIYVYTGDYRSYGSSPNLWDGQTIPAEVADDFVGGAMTYNPATGEWVKDVVILPTVEETNRYQQDQLQQEAAKVTENWKIYLQLGIITDEDKTKLTAWMMYIKALGEVNLSDPQWPVKPAN